MNASLSAALACGLTFGFAAPAEATCAPQKLVHITVVNVTPGIDTTSFAAQPKNFYRIGSDKLRIEEALDAANGIHAVIVVAEPRIWMANLYDGTGKLIVDPGPTYFARAPIVGTNLKGKLAGLEFACENDFIAANAPTPVRSEAVGTTRYDVYRIVDGADAVEILERPGSGKPSLIRYYRQGALAMVLRYDLYATDLPDDFALFIPPANIHYSSP
jgi:hypothetical protein